jgi:coenzyme F420 hydrogenase subunit beta
MNNNSNISEISAFRLCNTCSACQDVCSKQAITYEETIGGYYVSSVDKNLCVKCGTCISVCPGTGFNEHLLNSLPDDPFVGNALGAFVGKAQDKVIYRNSQSGGLVSALLTFGLEQLGLTGALTVAMVAGSPPQPTPKIARTKTEIIQSQKLKYCPIPLLCILDQLEQSDGPMAVVGLLHT